MSKPLKSLATYFHDYVDREITDVPTTASRPDELLWTVANLQGVIIALAQVLDLVADGTTTPAAIVERASHKLGELEELHRTLTAFSQTSGFGQAAQLSSTRGRTAGHQAVHDRFIGLTSTEHPPAQEPGAHHHVSTSSVEDLAKVVAALKAQNVPFTVSTDLERPE